jgi:predicted transposase YbfD/YdcC
MSAPAPRLFDHFAALDDPRVERTKRHGLLGIVAVALCAVVCGADTWVEVEQFGRAKEGWLRSFLALPNGIPSHDTFGRVFAALDPAQFEACFRSWVGAVAARLGGQVVAVDGKTLRRSHDRANGKAALELVGAWASEQRLVLGQAAVAAGGNEITAIPELLRLLELEGCTVTIDAIGCQTAIARQVVEQGADYVLALKGNQPALRAAVEGWFDEARAAGFRGLPHAARRTVEKGHGRLEVRRTWTTADPELLAYLDPAGDWPGLGCVAMVEAERRSGGTVARERRYYLSSLGGSAQAVAEAVRGHWGIENGLHWVLDVCFREDESRARTGHADRNLAVLRRLALNLLRQEASAKVGTRAKRLKAGWDQTYLLKILAG